LNFKISDSLSLPEDSALWTFADLAIKGAGKTYAACILAEEMVNAGIPIIALDGLGIWWGLRVGIDGKPGLPVVVFGGSHKDISIPVKSDKGRPVVDEERLKLMVKAILEARMSAVLDTSEFSKGMQRRIVAIFVNELYHLNKPYGVRHVFIEEADLWCPQRIMGDVAQSAGAIDDLVRRGGNFNLGCTLITQRSAVLNKDVLTQANCLIVLRILHKLDKKAVETWVESMAHPEDSHIKKWYDSLKNLKNGEAWLWHPEDPEIFERIQFRKRHTLHATREYFRQSKYEQKDIRMMDVGEFIAKFKSIFEPSPKMEVIPQTVVHVSSSRSVHEFPLPLQTEIERARREQRPEPIGPIQEIQIEEKAIVVKVSHSESIVKLDTDSQRGQIVFVLLQGARPLSQVDIINEMQEHGWTISQPVASAQLSKLVSDGIIVRDGRAYRLPRFVRFDVKEIA
jgi:hypothetical protein